MNELTHHGILGMKWGVRRYQNADGSRTSLGKRIQDQAKQKAYAIGAKLQPREHVYSVKRAFNKVDPLSDILAQRSVDSAKSKGVLTTNEKDLKAIEKVGIERHKNTTYSNLNDSDLNNLKKYTDAAVYSRAVNGYLATGSPKTIAEKAQSLKQTISKNTIDNQVVYRSCNLNFSTPGLAKKMSTMGDEQLSKLFDQMSDNFKGKSLKENRIYSTSTSPLFAIDTWRKVNPTAAKTYNAYLIIDCKGTPGLFADGRTSSGKKIVNTRSNQEAILAPNKMTYKKMTYDEERGMYAVYLEAS